MLEIQVANNDVFDKFQFVPTKNVVIGLQIINQTGSKASMYQLMTSILGGEFNWINMCTVQHPNNITMLRPNYFSEDK